MFIRPKLTLDQGANVRGPDGAPDEVALGIFKRVCGKLFGYECCWMASMVVKPRLIREDEHPCIYEPFSQQPTRFPREPSRRCSEESMRRCKQSDRVCAPVGSMFPGRTTFIFCCFDESSHLDHVFNGIRKVMVLAFMF